MTRNNRGKTAFFLFALGLFLIIGAIVMFAPFVQVKNGGASVDTMDGQFFYDEDFIYEAYAKMDKGAMTSYTSFHICDFFFLTSYCLLMMSLTLLVTDKGTKWAAMVLPLLPALFDVAENLSVEALTLQYPYMNAALVKIVPILTSMKWLLGVMWFVAFLVLLFRKIFIKARKK